MNKNLFKCIWAVVAGMLAIIVLSMVSDAALKSLDLFTPIDQLREASGMLFVALLYRCIYAVLGGYITAKLSPIKPMRQVLTLGVIGTIANLSGVFAQWELGDHWYPIILTITALPCTWWGGRLQLNKTANQ